jgi:polysaccharide biosynthesis protein PslH
MTKVLSVVWYKVLPARFGGQKGIAQFNQHLSRYFPLICICSANNQPRGDESYSIIPELPTTRFQVLNFLAWKRIIREIKKEQITHLILEHCYYGLLGIQVKKQFQKLLIVHSHNIEYMRFRKMGKPWWPFLYWLEKKTHRAADLSLFKTQADIDFAVSHFNIDPVKCLLVPFGLENKKFPDDKERSDARVHICTKHQISPQTRILLFMGTLDYEPNAEAVRKIVRQIIPGIRRITAEPFMIIVCGRLVDRAYFDLLKLYDDNYLYAGFVDDISPYFLAANMFINPVTTGGGIKVKLIEALSYGIPVITSENGATGVDMNTTGSQMVITKNNDIESFCKNIVNNWDRPASIPADFLEKYQWEKIVYDVAQRINKL